MFIDQLRDVRAVFYGKVTITMKKSFNKQLESWQCFSLLLRSRTLDLYCEESQINSWYIALASEVKKKNSKAFVLSIGRFLWRKYTLKLIDKYLLKGKDKALKSRVKLSLVKAILSAKNFVKL